jgi:TATA-box binding protein (TBP) (component of TFIID and TFIIIB)
MDYSISTITMSVSLEEEIELNLINIGKYLALDNHITGLKFNYGKTSILKGIYETTNYKKSKTKDDSKINKKLFFNQISLIVSINNHDINVKLFANGSLHLTGIKHPDEAKQIANLIYNKIQSINKCTDKILLTLDENGIYVDNNDIIYNSDNNMGMVDIIDIIDIIGFKHGTLYNIDKKDYEIVCIDNQNYFLCKTFEAKRTKRLLDLNGKFCGTYQIVLLKNKSKLYKNPNLIFDIKNKIIYFETENITNIIGKIVIKFINKTTITTVPTTVTKKENLKIINYNPRYSYSNNKFNVIYDNNNNNNNNKFNVICDINCINIVISFGYELNRQRLFNQLNSKKYICEYKPEKYSGMKFIYKNRTVGDSDGICYCSNKCTCNNITFLIFQSGNTIVTGFKSISEIETVLQNFNNILTPIKDIIIKRTLVLS